MAEACVSALVEWLKSDSDHLSSLSSNLFFISAPSYISCPVPEDEKEGKIVLIKKTRMVQLLTQLLRNDIVYPFAPESIGAAEEMQKICKEHRGKGPLRNEWMGLNRELFDLLSEAEVKEIEGKSELKGDENREKKVKELEERIRTMEDDFAKERKILEQKIKEKEEALTKLREEKDSELKKMAEDKKRLEEDKERLEKELAEAKGRIKKEGEKDGSWIGEGKGEEERRREGEGKREIITELSSVSLGYSMQSAFTINGNSITHTVPQEWHTVTFGPILRNV